MTWSHIHLRCLLILTNHFCKFFSKVHYFVWQIIHYIPLFFTLFFLHSSRPFCYSPSLSTTGPTDPFNSMEDVLFRLFRFSTRLQLNHSRPVVYVSTSLWNFLVLLHNSSVNPFTLKVSSPLYLLDLTIQSLVDVDTLRYPHSTQNRLTV